MFKPMLSGKVLPDLSNVRFPVLASLKLDGIRCLIQDGIAISRTLKPIPNQYVQQCLKGLPDGLDGELIVGNANDPNVFNITQSGIMSEDGMPEFKFYVFDWFRQNNTEKHKTFQNRYSHLTSVPDINIVTNPHTHTLPHYELTNKEVLLSFEAWALMNGYEGLMLRDPAGPYKFGRSTDKQGWLLKMKRFHDSEATIVGFEELERNQNDLETDERGYAKRSKCSFGMVGAETLGNVLAVLDNGISFSCGSGFNDNLRQEIWNNKEKYMGKRFKFKYQNWTADKKPRMPIFLGFRSD